MAYALTIVFLNLTTNPNQSIISIISLFIKQIVLGGTLGFVFGKTSKIIVNGIKLEFEGLYSVL